ncbi:hypothetical protein Ahy_A03g010291 [Arachis hypogaea]|uniref:Uncharacterized protein n=1 Tax=Arachis hypogaea TaxID=3818 RepID=A0A445DLV2_ARAHY|nr:hypothetical protein Ahy_A03g010291 [Arachis hypogaea]
MAHKDGEADCHVIAVVLAPFWMGTSEVQAQGTLQALHHILHERAFLAMIVQTTQGNLNKLVQTLLPNGTLQGRIHRQINVAILITAFYPNHKGLLLPILDPTLDHWPPTQHLQQNNPERVHVRLLTQPLTHVVLRVQIPQTTLHVRCHVGTIRPVLRQTEIRNFRDPIIVKQYVRALHVPVDHVLCVQEVKPTRRSKAYLQAFVPREGLLVVAGVVVVEVLA